MKQKRTTTAMGTFKRAFFFGAVALFVVALFTASSLAADRQLGIMTKSRTPQRAPVRLPTTPSIQTPGLVPQAAPSKPPLEGLPGASPEEYSFQKFDIKYPGDSMVGFQEQGEKAGEEYNLDRQDLGYQGDQPVGYDEKGIGDEGSQYSHERKNLSYKGDTATGYGEEGDIEKGTSSKSRQDMKYEGDNLTSYEEKKDTSSSDDD